MINFYKTLGLKDGASQEEIQEAYEKLSRKLDPDLNGNTDFFIEEYKKINEAYDNLKNTSILSMKTNEFKPIGSNNNLSKNEKQKDKYFRKNRFKAFFSKQNLIIFLLLLSLSSNVYLFIAFTITSNNYSEENKSIETSIADNRRKDYSIDEASSSSEEASSSSEEASSYADDAQSYMVRAEEYMNYAEEYMNNAASSAQEAEEYANAR